MLVLDGLCEQDGAGGVRFLRAQGLDDQAVATVQHGVRTKVLRKARTRGFLDPHEADQMLAWVRGGGFSLDASVLIADQDRESIERLIRYCARPAFAHERLRQLGPERYRYDAPKPGPKGNLSLIVSPLELLGRLADTPARHRR